VGFYGLAPDATILPVRVTERPVIDAQADPPVDPQLLAKGIDYAVSHGANVIDCGVVSYLPDKRVAAAVRRAVSKGVIVVAMVGDSHSDDRDGIGPTRVPPPYPASYPGVVGVGAVDENGRRVSTSQIGTYVDLVAPGGNVVASAIGGQSTFSGTGMASAFVAATAALALAEKPSLIGRVSGPALVREVTKRLLATGGPAISPQQGLAYGAGVVDPYAVLTEASSDHGPVALPPHATPVPLPPDPVKVAAARARHHSNGLALRLAGIIGGSSLLLIILALVLPRGRMQRWRATRAATPRDRTDDLPEFVPGEALFKAPGQAE
jgi:subtilisin family serine protease